MEDKYEVQEEAGAKEVDIVGVREGRSNKEYKQGVQDKAEARKSINMDGRRTQEQEVV